MSQYYNAKRVKNLYDPLSKDAFRISRSKIDDFLKCERCFYLDRRLGIAQPPGYPFSLNTAVDTLLKKEFDLLRKKGEAHPLMKKFGIDAVPYDDKRMDEWRDALKGGVRYAHPETNLLITGGVDDIWVNPQGELHVVDYKATAKDGEVSLDADWQISYKRQVEVYQWLLRRNDFKVSDTAYFVYCNGDTAREVFDGRLEFEVKIIPYTGNDSWVDGVILDLHHCLNRPNLPDYTPDCDYCAYRVSAKEKETPLRQEDFTGQANAVKKTLFG